MAPTIYVFPSSPPSRAVLMTAKAIGLELDIKQLDFMKGEHTSPEYIKLNPQHTVPTLVDDDGTVVWDSHAVMSYIVSKYGKDDSYYPQDVKKRATVDQRLHFEGGVVFVRMLNMSRNMFTSGAKTVAEDDKNGILEVYGFLEAFLSDGKRWIAGNAVTIADFSLISSVTSVAVIVAIDPSKYPKLTAWLKRAEGLPTNEINKEGLRNFTEMMKKVLG